MRDTTEEHPGDLTGPELRRWLLHRIYDGLLDGAALSNLAAAIEDRISKGGRTAGATRRQDEASWSADDVWLIAYPDHFQRPGEPPLVTLRQVMGSLLSDVCTGLHVLPFFPSTSDEGFSIADHRAVDDAFGSWDDIEALAGEWRLMVDAVVNHVSATHPWFEGFLAGEEGYGTFFHVVDEGTDVGAVVRPRAHPLLTEFVTSRGSEHVWTTFSADQVDLNFQEPEVLLEILDVVIDYAQRGASVVRLDAVGFVWKNPGRASIHEPETHRLVQLMRSCLDAAVPGTALISETNVPHHENISYFHRDPAEVHAVYQFALPPLVAHATLSGDVDALVNWANHLAGPSGDDQTFLNFLASHDGIGMRPAEGLLTASQVAGLVKACEEVGGRVSYRSTPKGLEPYELNTTWFDLMTQGVDEAVAVARHLASHAMLLALPGIVGLYAPSLFGTPNDLAALAASGYNRTVNRQRFSDVDDLLLAAKDETQRSGRILEGLTRLVARRRSSPAFHPSGRCQVSDLGGGAVAIERSYRGHEARWVIDFSGDDAVRTSHDGGRLEPYGIRFVR